MEKLDHIERFQITFRLVIYVHAAGPRTYYGTLKVSLSFANNPDHASWTASDALDHIRFRGQGINHLVKRESSQPVLKLESFGDVSPYQSFNDFCKDGPTDKIWLKIGSFQLTSLTIGKRTPTNT